MKTAKFLFDSRTGLGTNRATLYDELTWMGIFIQQTVVSKTYSFLQTQNQSLAFVLLQIHSTSLTLVRLLKRSTFDVYDIEKVKLLSRLRVEFSDLSSHRFKRNFLCIMRLSSKELCNLLLSSAEARS